MKNLIILSHPDGNSFNAAIAKTIQETLESSSEEVKVIDLYKDQYNIIKDVEKTDLYKGLITWSERIYFVSPVWWFRTTPLLESFFDQVFTPGFAYNFIKITGLYGYPKPLLSDKRVRTYLTHGAPSLPVLTLYLNSVKLRLVMGVYSFVFGWFKTKTRQFWSVPFVKRKVREKYLSKVKRDILKDIIRE